MVLVKRQTGFRYFIVRAIAGVGIAFPLYLAHASSRSRTVDQEFTWAPQRDIALNNEEHEAVSAAARNGDEKARLRLQQIMEKDGGRTFDPHGGRVLVKVKGDKNAEANVLRPTERPSTLPKTHRAAAPFEEVTSHSSFGDIALFMGTGDMSWKITRLGYLGTALNTDALRYSHVGMIVGPLPDACVAAMQELKRRQRPAAQADRPWWRRLFSGSNSSGASSSSSPTPLLDAIMANSSPERPLILEAIDNKDCNAPNVLPAPDKLLHDQVMISALADRTYGVDYREAQPRWCYNRLALRRVVGVEWTPERVEAVEAWLRDTLGRPMDKSPRLSLAMVDPRLHKRTDPRTISCSEVVAEGLATIGVIPRMPNERWREQGGGKYVPPIMYAPFHFGSTGQHWMGWEYLPREPAPVEVGAYKDRTKILVAPEERVDMSRTLLPAPPKPDAAAASKAAV